MGSSEILVVIQLLIVPIVFLLILLLAGYFVVRKAVRDELKERDRQRH